MKLAVLCSLLVFLPWPDRPCAGCVAKQLAMEANPAGVAVPFDFDGRGRAGLKLDKGKCVTSLETCEAVGCTLAGSLTIRNRGEKPIGVGCTGFPLVTLQPGESTTVNFTDPVTGEPSRIACGGEIKLDLFSHGADPVTGRDVSTTRTFRWTCSACNRETVREP